MTSNERIILKCLWDAKGKAHICFISRVTGLSSDYARLLARSLERAGYLKFADANVCYLLTKGRGRLEDSVPIVETVESDAIVNPEIIPEIIVETVSASVSEKEEPPSEDKSLDEAISELNQSSEEEVISDSPAPEEPELIDGEDQKLEEIQNEILEEAGAANAQQPAIRQQEEGEEILEEILREAISEENIIKEEIPKESPQDIQEEIEEKIKEKKEGRLSKLRKSIWKK